MNTTISISKEVRDKIKEFGNKGESYTNILQKLYESAKDRQIQDLLMNEADCSPIGDAIERAKQRWQE
jgi:predicted CopG family antitoxin